MRDVNFMLRIHKVRIHEVGISELAELMFLSISNGRNSNWTSGFSFTSVVKFRVISVMTPVKS